ncbi:DUF4258 domain-containing protein [Candidatus Daviesbacteria bacterium]|nr:DUF4258 domain-containing protein [Candidatus Daviesbacteria bacterium]
MIIYTKHAKEMLLVRSIDKKLVDKCAVNPDHVLPGDYERKIYLTDFGVNYLKLVVSEEGKNIVIITVHWLDKKRVKK